MRCPSLPSWSSALTVLCAVAPAAAAVQGNNGTKPVPYKVQTPPLDTDWTHKVGKNPWPEHPRPQLERTAWKNLNGIWTFQNASSNDDMATLPATQYLEREVLVPSCIESGLSGIQDTSTRFMWFKTQFEVPSDWKNQSVLLNFEAVDYEATVFVNGQKVGNNVGGYFRFTVDVTKAAKMGQKNDL